MLLSTTPGCTSTERVSSPSTGTPTSWPSTVAFAPYLLTTVIKRPRRLIYLSSGMHRDGDPSLRDIDWHDRRWNGVQAYCDSKLYVTALAMAVARRWPTTFSNTVDPGWVPTRMGGANAPDDLNPRPPHPNLARGRRRACSEGDRPLLVPPASPRTGSRSERPCLSGCVARPARRTDRLRLPPS